MNKVILVGRLVREPELRTTQSGVNVCSFTVACDRRYQKEGERQADFINCIAWRNTADFISNYFTKGTRIALDGSIQTRSWDAEDGTKRYATEVIVEHAEFAQSKSEGNSGSITQPEYTFTGTNNIDSAFDDIDISEEDLPF